MLLTSRIADAWVDVRQAEGMADDLVRLFVEYEGSIGRLRRVIVALGTAVVSGVRAR